MNKNVISIGSVIPDKKHVSDADMTTEPAILRFSFGAAITIAAPASRRQAVLGRQIPTTTPWLTERHG